LKLAVRACRSRPPVPYGLIYWTSDASWTQQIHNWCETFWRIH